METNTSEDITQKFNMFKSYYVVWKRRSVDEKEIIEISLNRTM